MTYKIYKYRNIIDLAQRIPFKDVARALKYHYPYPRISKNTMNRYKEIMLEMSKYKEDPNKDKEWSLLISLSRPFKFYSKSEKKWIVMDEPGEEYYGTHGLKKGEKKMTYAIELTPWQEAANWKIADEVLKHYKPAEILAHFLWEMTFCGYEQKEVKKFTDDLHDRIDKVTKNPKKYSKPYDIKNLTKNT
ncbi:MAG: DUF6557 family protein [Candidatus Pacearchaeota archaeon]|jgi:hypothetical protein